MKKEQILDNIADEATKKSVGDILAYCELLVKTAGMQKSEVEIEIKTALKDLGIKSENVEGLEAYIETKMVDLAKAVKTLQEKGGAAGEQTFYQELKEVFDLKKDDIMEAAKGGAHVNFRLKTAATVVTSANFGSGVVLGYRESQVDGTLPNEFEPITLISRMNGGPSSNPLSWVQRVANPAGGAAGYAENSEAVSGTTIKALQDFTWTEASANAVTLAVMSVLSKRSVNNYPMLQQEVQQELLISLRNKLNSEIINGTDSTTSLKGIIGYATTFVTTGISVTNANPMDVLLLAWKQSRKAYKGSRPNAILVSIGSGVDMDLTKNDFGQYIFPQFMINQDKTLKGVPIIEADDITDGDFLLGDFTKCLFNVVEDVSVEIGWMNDQFGKNQFTIRAEMEGMQRVKSQFAGSFITGTFSSIISAINNTGIPVA